MSADIETGHEETEEAALRGPSAFAEIRILFDGTPQAIADALTRAGTGAARIVALILGRTIRGGIELGRRAGQWLAVEPAVRLMSVTAGAGLGYVYPPVLAVAGGGLLLAALANGGTPAEAAADDHDESVGEKPTFDLVQETEWAVAEAFAAGRKGVHLTVLYTRLHPEVTKPSKHQLSGLHVDLLAAKIPVTEQLGMIIDGVKVNQRGVRSDELTKTLGHAPRLPAPLVQDYTLDNHMIRLDATLDPSSGPLPSSAEGE
ncbi:MULTISPECIES: hypothetical protein [unclassified Streptomyces]|uniref:Uncharacterized protein n=1 Tax=Streptomyces sp. NBC_00119 TaxID=2975659 RepID=A0AAU1U7U4_9ACTN|nr:MULTISPECIES: hypothetical protein [unclassified Streptomyces]MCX4644079.1 hypothetical protein [Streptomyces sp. NBC_01446]MCX5325191.1 hypothetical protein [Streptomyces sp. NBC_00120]